MRLSLALARHRPHGTYSVCVSESPCCANFQRLLHEKKSEVAALITREAGKPYVEALLTEVMVVLDADALLHRECLSTFCANKPVPHGNLAMKTKTGRCLREPHGVIGIISPWNYPFSIPATESLVCAGDRECSGAETLRAHFAERAAIGFIAASRPVCPKMFSRWLSATARGLRAF